jgi:hypothetical protein
MNLSSLTTVEILKLHEELETKHNDGGSGSFVFGWQCENPFASEFISAVFERSATYDRTKYHYLEDDTSLCEMIPCHLSVLTEKSVRKAEFKQPVGMRVQ